MKVTISSIHFKTDRKLEEFIKQKVEKLSKNYDQVLGSDVVLKIANSNDQINKIAEIRLLIPGNDLFARKQSRTFEEATDQAIDALKKQLERHKAKVNGR